MNFGPSKTDIAIIGHLAKDLIEIDGKIKEAIGGEVYYGALAGNQMGLKIAIITRLKKSDWKMLEVFNQKGIQVFATPSEETSGIHNIYSSNNMEFRDYTPLGFAGNFRISEIPPLNTEFFVIGSIVAGEVKLDLFRYLVSKNLNNLCVDIQGFIRVRSQKKLFYKDLNKQEKKEILSKTNVLKVDQTELKILTKETKIKQGAKILKPYGPKEILITHEKGISVLTDDEYITFPWKNSSSLGRTGRGDTAFISYLGSRITKNPRESLKFSAALTSLKLETPGAFSLPIDLVDNLIKKEYSNSK
jgi:sugar/nucleoside kinase (ribokinase family)